MRKITADFLLPISAEPIPNGVIIIDPHGRIVQIDRRENHNPATLEFHHGAILPGFVNTHCHLELSHMKAMADTGTGLLPFLKTVVNFRDFPMETILDAIDRADRYMYDQGISAVGDISNKLDTAQTKNNSRIRYYSFVEMFDFLQEGMAEQAFNGYHQVFEGQSQDNGNRKTCVPHAPYTVSPALFQKLRDTQSAGDTVSIHNQETVHENDLFLTRTGDFLDFYQSFGFPLDHFRPTGKTSIHYALEHLRPDCRTLFVHNTLTTPDDIRAAQTWSRHTYWATCPNANLYIENRLPNYRHFLDTGARVTIGTDSLTSNWQLSIWEEIKTIRRYQSYIPQADLLRWATLNGAEALGFDDDLGSLEVGKVPGLVLAPVFPDGALNFDGEVKRLV